MIAIRAGLRDLRAPEANGELAERPLRKEAIIDVAVVSLQPFASEWATSRFGFGPSTAPGLRWRSHCI